MFNLTQSTCTRRVRLEISGTLYMYVHDLRLPSVLTVSFLRSDPTRPAAGREKERERERVSERERGGEEEAGVGRESLTPGGHAGLHIRHCTTRWRLYIMHPRRSQRVAAQVQRCTHTAHPSVSCPHVQPRQGKEDR